MVANPLAEGYRPDIDGLRAIAVLCVVAFHAFPEWVTGGFIGVDIFFVISGYLISSIIFSQMDQGRFTFSGFYARRVRRIFPALLLVLGATYLFGNIALLPMERMYLGMQLVAGAGFLSNFMFWQSLGYFAPDIDALPLMHLWSLSIEEQFYVVWPLLLVLSFRQRNSLLLVLCLFAVVSFSVNLHEVYGDATTAFYLPHCRFWEMAAGGILAWIVLYRPAVLAGKSLLLSVTGALLLAVGLLLINKERFFPGAWALLPVTGTCLLIAAGPQAWLNRQILGWRWMLATGLISYPLYLWHWPLLSFARILEESTPSVTIRVSAVALAIVLSALTYWLLEQPLRKRHPGRLMVTLLCVGMLAMLGLGWRMAQPPELTQAQQTGIGEFEEDWIGWHKCNNTWDCRVLDPSRPVDVAVIGDSHSGHLGTGLAYIFRPTGMNVVVKQRPMCLPFFTQKVGDKKYFDCVGFIDRALEDSLASSSIHTIILSGYANNFIYKYPDGVPGNANLRDLASNLSSDPNPAHVAAFARGLDETLARLLASGKRVIFLVDNPELDFEPRECVSVRVITLPGYTVRSPCAVSRAVYEVRAADYLRIVAEAQRRFPAVNFVYTHDALCDARQCRAMQGNELLYSDRSHLSPAGSRLVLDALRDSLLPR